MRGAVRTQVIASRDLQNKADEVDLTLIEKVPEQRKRVRVWKTKWRGYGLTP